MNNLSKLNFSTRHIKEQGSVISGLTPRSTSSAIRIIESASNKRALLQTDNPKKVKA